MEISNKELIVGIVGAIFIGLMGFILMHWNSLR
jgi:hypothetical protein